MTLNAAAGRTFSARNIIPFLPLLVYAALVLVVVAIYFSFFRQFETLIQEGKMRDLGAIADVKVGQITAWRDNQKRTAEAIARDSLLVDEFGLWLREGASAEGRGKRLRKMLAELQYVNGYQTLILLDRKGTVRLSLTEGAVLEMGETLLAKRAMDGREVLFSDIHRNSYGDKAISIDLIAPLIAGGSEAGRVIGAAVLQIDPHTYLYPLINTWPVASASAETLLVRQEGDGILFLNDVRHRQGTALTLRMPLDTPRLPSASALHGSVHIADGIDYRGVPVVAEMRQVAGTPWFVVSKVDHDELFAPVNRLRQWSTTLGLTVALIGGLLVFVWLQGHRARVRSMQSQHMAALERQMLMKHFEYLTKYANDIIMLADESGRIVEANERAQQAYGYTRQELLQMRIPDLRDPGEDPAVLQRQLARLREFGELRFETVNVRKDGTRFPIESSARIIEVEGTRYLQGIIRDISERKQAEDSLRRSETLLKKSQQMAHIGSWELDLKNNLLYWSDENHRIFELNHDRFGVSYEAFLGIVHPDDREWVNRTYIDSVHSRQPYSIIHRLLFPDGRIKFVQEWCETSYDEEGQPLRSIGTTQDVTEQQLVQNALRKSAQQIEDLYNHAPCGYHSLDKGGVIVQINDTELQWLGYEREEVIGRMNFTELIAPGYRQVFRDSYPRFKEKGEVRDLEYELVRKDGTSFFVLLSATAVYDADGVYLMSRSTLFDITERKQAEKKLEESQELFRTMADSAPIMIWIADVQDQGDCTGCQGCNYFNQRWYEFTGRPQVRGGSCEWESVIHAEDERHFLDAYREAFRNQQTFNIEYRLRRHDGVFRWVRDSGVPRYGTDGSFLGFIGTTLDVTDLKLFDELRAEVERAGRLQIAGEMASGLAHELSQPVSATNNYLSACLRHMEERDWDKVRLLKMVSLAHAQVERAGGVINHLKDMVRQQPQAHIRLDINTLVRDTVHFMEFEIRQKSVAVIMDFYELPQPLVSKIEIEQVLINLIKNAIDSMESVPRRVLRITTRINESGFIQVSVSDTGKGIAPDELDKVFNPFQTSKKDGLGLGLAICRSLVERHGGQIWAERPGDEGTRFNFTLPVGENDA